MVDILSPDQHIALREYRKTWLGRLTDAHLADRNVAEAGVKRAYIAAGLSPPERIEWCAGPRELARRWRASTTSSSAGRLSDVGPNVRRELFDTVFSRTVSAVERQCGRARRQAVAEAIRLGRPTPVGASVLAATLQAIDEPVARSIGWFSWFRRRAHRSGVTHRMSFQDSGYSPHEFNWLGTYQFMHDAMGVVEPTSHLEGHWAFAPEISWIVPHARVCWLAEPVAKLAFDANERLHCADGPAILYRDNVAVHAWKGVLVPASIIEHPSRITARNIDRELDPVVRRCMIDILTPERYIATGSPVRISQDETGILWRKLWWGFDAWAAVEVVNGTAEPDGHHKHYFLQVPPTVRTAREAVAWTYGLSENQYAGLKMRT